MFNNAIADIIELHIKDLDKSQNGIYGKLNEVNEMLVVWLNFYLGNRAKDMGKTVIIKNRSFFLLF